MTIKPWLFASFLIAACLGAQAQRADGIYQIKCIVQTIDVAGGQKKDECTTQPRRNPTVGIGDKVGFEVVTTHELMDQEGAPEVTDLNLVLDGQVLPGTHPVVEGQTDELLPSTAPDADEKDQGKDWVVTFRLSFPVTRDLSSDKGKESWKKLLGGMGKERKEVPVSVGLINGPPLPSPYRVELIRLRAARLVIFLAAAVVLGIGFWAVATKTGALRDKEPSPKDPQGNDTIGLTDRAYSLSRSQIAAWTLLVVYAYLFIWLVTGEYNTVIPGTILAILGISAGTYATASAIDRDKEKDPKEPAKVVKTEGLSSDLFTGSGGASLHRVQFGLWSVVLMIVFVITAYETLAMPEFDKSLLGLMGISSAAYAGLKIPEKKQ